MLDNGKARVDKTFNGLKIFIPSKKNWFGLLFGTAWLGGWFFGFKSVSSMLFSTGHFGVDGFLTFWLIAWTFGGLAIISILLWGYFGREKFILSNGEILFEKSVFGVGQKRRLSAAEVKNIRTEEGNDSWLGSNRWAFWGLGPGKIKFDYGMRTYSFGLALDDAEANYISGLLKEQIKDHGQSQLFPGYESIK